MRNVINALVEMLLPFGEWTITREEFVEIMSREENARLWTSLGFR